MKRERLQGMVATDTKVTVLKLAKYENRSESNMVDILILEALIHRDRKAKGYKPL